MSQLVLRPYQQGAIDSIVDYWAAGGGNPLVDMATGLGKSVVIAKLVRDLLAAYPTMRILMLVHVQELVAQNFQALLRVWPDAPAGVYSAGLGRRDTHHRITFASIQSIFKIAGSLGDRHLVLIDEAHLVPEDGDGMYQQALDKLAQMVPDLRIAGFTATPFRMKSGRLDGAGHGLFSQLVYSYGIAAGIEDGWLSPLTSKRGATEIDVSGVAKRGGEFVSGALQAASNRSEITDAACDDIIARGQSRRSWLVFCAGVDHAHAVRQAMQDRGIGCATITGETDQGERMRAIADFKSGRLRCLTNANVLTTGFDAPETDLIALLRPTMSKGLYVQMAGRGTRPVYERGFDPNSATAEERRASIAAGPKPNCLFLDYTGTVRRMGPVDMITVDPKKPSDGMSVTVNSVMTKECPVCAEELALAARVCTACGEEFIFDSAADHATEAEDVEILSSGLPKANEPDTVPVVAWFCRQHDKDGGFAAGGSSTMCVSYSAGLMQYREFVTVQHSGQARDRARTWWRTHGGATPEPTTVLEALSRFGELTRPTTIQVRKNGKWWDICGRTFAPPEEQVRGAA